MLRRLRAVATSGSLGAFVPWAIVAFATLLRAVGAARLPLTGDEAYYWEWSRHLAAGYADHPPAVAYAIALLSWFGQSPFAVRLPFILCGLFATIVIAATATRLAGGDVRAGRAAALAMTLCPMVLVTFAIATPDGPYLLAWACSLYCAVRAFGERSRWWFVALGVALGVALLSRLFALALAAGIVAVAFGRRDRAILGGVGLALGIAALLWLPFVIWNAGHGWETFDFALFGRHANDELRWTRPLEFAGLSALAYSPGLYLLALAVALRPRQPLVAWTALPLLAILFAVSVHERIEVYWLLGPYLSLSIGLGVAYVDLARRTRSIVSFAATAPAAVLCSVVFIAALMPGAVYARVQNAGVHLSDDGPFEMFTYAPLARDIAGIARGDVVMTDGYGFSSLLDFYATVPPVVIGYDSQGAEARRWYGDGMRPRNALFVDKVPLDRRADFRRRLAAVCRRVVPGPVLRYAYADSSGVRIPARRYFTTWCDGMSSDAVPVLRWERPDAMVRVSAARE